MPEISFKRKRPKANNDGTGARTKDVKLALLAQIQRPWIEQMRANGNRAYPPRLMELCAAAGSSRVTFKNNFKSMDGFLMVSRRALTDSVAEVSAGVSYAMRHFGVTVGWETLLIKLTGTPDHQTLLEFNLRWEDLSLWEEALAPFSLIIRSAWSEDDERARSIKQTIFLSRFAYWLTEWMESGFPQDRSKHYAEILAAEHLSLRALKLPVEQYMEGEIDT